MAEVVIDGSKSSTIGAGAVPDNVVKASIEDEDTTTDLNKEGKETVNDEEASKETAETVKKTSDTTDDGNNFVVAGVDVASYAAEYEKSGKLSEDSYKALAEKGFSKELVDAYIRGLEGQAEEKGGLAKKEVDNILADVGGEDRYNKIMAWASVNLTQEEQDAYDKLVTMPDPAVARLAVQGLLNRYEREKGHPPSLIQGGKAPDVPAGFKNRSEMIAAMSDKRYGSDPEYTREVEMKVRSSGIMRGRR